MFRLNDGRRNHLATLPGVVSVERRNPGWVVVITDDATFEITTDDPTFDAHDVGGWYYPIQSRAVARQLGVAADDRPIASVIADVLAIDPRALDEHEVHREHLPCTVEIRPRPADGTSVSFTEISVDDAWCRVVDARRAEHPDRALLEAVRAGIRSAFEVGESLARVSAVLACDDTGGWARGGIRVVGYTEHGLGAASCDGGRWGGVACLATEQIGETVLSERYNDAVVVFSVLP